MKIAYKVVKLKKQERFKKTVYTSCIDNAYSVEYQVGKITVPVIGSLFVFSEMPTHEQINYIIPPHLDSSKVFKCLVDLLTIAEEIVYVPHNSSYIEKFWNGGLSYELLKKPPVNTCFCNECVLLEDVTKQIK